MKQRQQLFSILIRHFLISLSTFVERYLAKASGFVDPSHNADSSADNFQSTLFRGGSLIADPEVVLSYCKIKSGSNSNLF